MGLNAKNQTNDGGEPEQGRPHFVRTGTFNPQLSDPRSVYIHVPFCRHRCGYCNFALVAGRDYLINRFLSALETEIGWLDRTYEIETLFLGGGTPSHLSPSQLNRLSEIIKSRFLLSGSAEVTAECNPNDLDEARMKALSQLGVNRISLGVQSLDANKLKSLERDHTIDDVRSAVSIAKTFGADVSIDLIFAAPSETLAEWNFDLDNAMELQPNHFSTYELTYEKGTQFWNRLGRGEVSVSGEELRADMYSLAIEKLRSAGFIQYEVSSFAQAEKQCRHNRAYWIGDPFFAFGPGAARFVDGIRETNHQSTTRYLKLIESGESPVSDREYLDQMDAAKERLAIGLRMLEGVSDADFLRRTGVQVVEVLGDLQHKLVENGLLISPDVPKESGIQRRWKLTGKGILVCDWIAGEIVGA